MSDDEEALATTEEDIPNSQPSPRRPNSPPQKRKRLRKNTADVDNDDSATRSPKKRSPEINRNRDDVPQTYEVFGRDEDAPDYDMEEEDDVNQADVRHPYAASCAATTAAAAMAPRASFGGNEARTSPDRGPRPPKIPRPASARNDSSSIFSPEIGFSDFLTPNQLAKESVPQKHDKQIPCAASKTTAARLQPLPVDDEKTMEEKVEERKTPDPEDPHGNVQTTGATRPARPRPETVPFLREPQDNRPFHETRAGNVHDYERAYWNHLRALDAAILAQDAEDGEDRKHTDDQDVDIATMDPMKWCGWHPQTPLEPRVKFVKEVREFGTSSDPRIIAKFLLTLEYLNEHPNTAEFVWALFSQDNTATRAKTEYTVRCNIAFCLMLQKHEVMLKNTPFEYVSDAVWRARLRCLQVQHKNNCDWYRNMLLSKEYRTSGRVVAPLFPTPAATQDAAAAQNRDGIKEDDRIKLLDFMFQAAGRDCLRRSADSVYAPHITPEGYNTRCFEIINDLEPWIRDQVTPQDTYPAEHNWLMKKDGTVDYIRKHLAAQPDARFPFIERCRSLFSYRNGIYCAYSNSFYCYILPKAFSGNPRIKHVSQLPSNVATAKYFDVPVDLTWFSFKDQEYRKIPCPYTESIFEAQWMDEARRDKMLQQDGKLDEERIDSTEIPNCPFRIPGLKLLPGVDYESIDWAQALFGRLQHNVGSLDDWQSTIHLQGPAKTGKSLMLKLITLWYYATDIGLIGDNTERNFPDQHLIKKFVVMCMDVSSRFALEPTRFLQWCSGDFLEIHRKGKEAISMKWTAPSIWASNGPPPIVGNAGSTRRRYVILQFLLAVMNADGHLFAKCADEQGFHIIKCSMAYHHKTALHGAKNLYDQIDILPERFHKSLDEYAMASSWTEFFLLSEKRFEFWRNKKKLDATLPKESVFTTGAEFRRHFAYFKGTHQLPGVNAYIAPTAIECNSSTFANALAALGCYWNEKKDVVYGLQLNIDTIHEQQEGANAQQQGNHNNSNHRRGGGGHRTGNNQYVPPGQHPFENRTSFPPGPVTASSPAPTFAQPIPTSQMSLPPITSQNAPGSDQNLFPGFASLLPEVAAAPLPR